MNMSAAKKTTQMFNEVGQIVIFLITVPESSLNLNAGFI